MNAKLDGYTSGKVTQEQVSAAAELAPELTPDPGVVVPTGGEAAPTKVEHRAGMNNLYDKARKNRNMVQRKDGEDAPDVKLIQALVAEAASGEDGSTVIDTNRNMDEAETKELARMMAEQAPPTVAPPAAPAPVLQRPPVESIVGVKILGKEYQVSQQDIDDAGGLVPYQKNRAATIRLQKAATAESAAQAILDAAEKVQRGNLQTPDPSKDGLSTAEHETLKGELMDAVIDGSSKRIDEVFEKIATSRPKAAQPAPSPAVTTTPFPRGEAQQELERLLEQDRLEANELIRTEFPDILYDLDALGMARQKYKEMQANPENEGRSQVELVRASARAVKKFVEQFGLGSLPSAEEKERQTRIERKRSFTPPSQADATAPSGVPQERHVPTGKEHLERLRRRAGHDLAR
jgi:hypothetical protein